VATVLRDYIQAAMRRAKYEIVADDGTYYGEIPECDGVWANSANLEECRDQLEEVLEEWLLIGISRHHSLPVIDGIDLTVKESA
jgi:predicted RNase H-like HicB family nuclease